MSSHFRPYRRSSYHRKAVFITAPKEIETTRRRWAGSTENRFSRSSVNQSPSVIPARTPGPQWIRNHSRQDDIFGTAPLVAHIANAGRLLTVLFKPSLAESLCET